MRSRIRILSILCAFVVAALAAGACAKTSTTPSDTPVIVKFEASVTQVTVAQNQAAVLSWKVLPGSGVTVSIEPEPGGGLQTEGSRTVIPRNIGANVYTLYVSTPGGGDPAKGTVTIFGR